MPDGTLMNGVIAQAYRYSYELQTVGTKSAPKPGQLEGTSTNLGSYCPAQQRPLATIETRTRTSHRSINTYVGIGLW